MVIIAGRISLSAFPWCSLTAVEMKERPAVTHWTAFFISTAVEAFVKPIGLVLTDWTPLDKQQLQCKCQTNASWHSLLQSLPEFTLRTEVEQCWCRQPFSLQNTDDVYVINWVLGRRVRVLLNLDRRIPSVDKVAWAPYILIWKVLWMESEMLLVSLFLKRQMKSIRGHNIKKGVSLCVVLFFCPPEEVWRSNDHVLEVLERQTSVIVQVSLIYHFLTNHRHLLLGQLVPSQFVQGLLQVWLAYEVIIVKILTEKRGEIMSNR